MKSLVQDLICELSAQNFIFPSIEETKIDILIEYVKLVNKWNSSHDLVSQKSIEDIFKHHILDSIAAFVVYKSKFDIEPDRYIDIGTGAGLPGIVWHVLFDQKVKTKLYEPRAKRVSFLKEVRKNLSLTNVEIFESNFSEIDSLDGGILGTIRALNPSHEIVNNFFKQSLNRNLLWLASSSEDNLAKINFVKVTSINYFYRLDEVYSRSLIILDSYKSF